MEPAYKQLIVKEFLDASPIDRRHYELIEGVIVAMASPAIPNQAIAARLTAEMVRPQAPTALIARYAAKPGLHLGG